MKTALPIAWFVLVVLVVAGTLTRILMADPAQTVQIALITLPSTLTGVLWMAGTALAYLFAIKTVSNIAVAILGFVHLFFAAIASLSAFAGGRLQDSMMANGDFSNADMLGAFFGASGLTNAIGGLLFIAAMIVAIVSAPKTAEKTETFG